MSFLNELSRMTYVSRMFDWRECRKMGLEVSYSRIDCDSYSMEKHKVLGTEIQTWGLEEKSRSACRDRALKVHFAIFNRMEVGDMILSPLGEESHFFDQVEDILSSYRIVLIEEEEDSNKVALGVSLKLSYKNSPSDREALFPMREGGGFREQTRWNIIFAGQEGSVPVKVGEADKLYPLSEEPYQTCPLTHYYAVIEGLRKASHANKQRLCLELFKFEARKLDETLDPILNSLARGGMRRNRQRDLFLLDILSTTFQDISIASKRRKISLLRLR